MTRVAVLMVVLLAHGALAADAPESAWRPDTMFLQSGGGSSTKTWTAGLQWDWKRRWPVGSSLELTGRWEVSLGRWRTDTSWRRSIQVWSSQLTTAPTFRLSRALDPTWFAEAGIGPSLLWPLYYSRERQFSTVFNFESHVMLGRAFGPAHRHEVGVRMDHYSNARIEQPNPGVTLFAIRYAVRL